MSATGSIRSARRTTRRARRPLRRRPAPSPTATTATRDPSAAPRPAAPATRPRPLRLRPPRPGPARTGSPRRLASILSDLSGIDASSLDATASFAELGFDSLFLTQANAQFRKQFGVRITFRQLFEEAPSIDTLAAFIDSKLAPDALPAPVPEAPVVAADPAVAVAAAVTQGQGQGSGSTVEWLIREQLRIMEQQLALVRSGELPAGRPASGAGAERCDGSERRAQAVDAGAREDPLPRDRRPGPSPG